jgi:hypothetical protein
MSGGMSVLSVENISMPKITVDEDTAKLVRRLYPQVDRLSRARYYQLLRKVRAEMARDTDESGSGRASKAMKRRQRSR